MRSIFPVSFLSRAFILASLGCLSLTSFAFASNADAGADSNADGNGTSITSSNHALDKGIQYFQGDGVETDLVEAAKWFHIAADQGNLNAHLNLGFLYDLGLGVEQDHSQAAKHYQEAAVQGEPTAQFNLGILYSFGKGVDQDYTLAAEWYSKAANQGLADAQFNLGVLYEEGRGVPQSSLIAEKWYILATANEHEGARLRREAMKSKLTPEESLAAWKSAYEWGIAYVSHADDSEEG